MTSLYNFQSVGSAACQRTNHMNHNDIHCFLDQRLARFEPVSQDSLLQLARNSNLGDQSERGITTETAFKLITNTIPTG